MKYLENFLCCISLRFGAFVIGLFEIFASLLTVFLYKIWIVQSPSYPDITSRYSLYVLYFFTEIFTQKKSFVLDIWMEATTASSLGVINISVTIFMIRDVKQVKNVINIVRIIKPHLIFFMISGKVKISIAILWIKIFYDCCADT